MEHNLFTAGDNRAGFLVTSEDYSPGRPLPLGRVTANLPAVPVADEDTRNNRLLAQAVRPLRAEIDELRERFGSHRIGILTGTSTSGIAEGEAALIRDGDQLSLAPGYDYRSQELAAPSRFLSRWLALDGPAWSLSSACTSGGKALASAARLLSLDVCDAVIAGGVDSLCRMTVAGFSALTVTADGPCNPFSRNRQGINIGEGAAVFLVTRETGPVQLSAWGETSDAHHISSPDPEGRGAAEAMRQALHAAAMSAADIDYINLHGTGTGQNDLMESLAVNRVFGDDVPCSSTKPLTGHTLGAAGALEALFCWLALQRDDGRLPPHIWDGVTDPELAPLGGLGRLAADGRPRHIMSNSFAFGGNNLALILSRGAL